MAAAYYPYPPGPTPMAPLNPAPKGGVMGAVGSVAEKADLWLKIDQFHLNYLKAEESTKKIDIRNKLQGQVITKENHDFTILFFSSKSKLEL